MILNINADCELLPEVLAFKLQEAGTEEQERFFEEFINDIDCEQIPYLAEALSRDYTSAKQARKFFEDLARRIKAEMIVKFGGDYD